METLPELNEDLVLIVIYIVMYIVLLLYSSFTFTLFQL